MKIIKAILFGAFIFAAICKGQDDTEKFRYRAGKGIPVGTVLHYVKTNLDGTRPEYVSQFIAADDVLESFKFHPHDPPAGLVIAEMNWQIFSAKSLKSWRVFSRDERKLFGTIMFDAATRRAEVSLPTVKSEPESFVFKHVPVHLYNFDFASLNFAFPHLVKPQDSFVIGVTDPTFQATGALVEYKGEVTISYQADEKRNQVWARKYRIDGAGLKHRGGFIWVNKKHGWIEDMEIALPDNPEWTSFKFKLLRVEKMNRVEWNNFINRQLSK
jgi:hypothetical protein